jgi:hypothetical protein
MKLSFPNSTAIQSMTLRPFNPKLDVVFTSSNKVYTYTITTKGKWELMNTKWDDQSIGKKFHQLKKQGMITK